MNYESFLSEKKSLLIAPAGYGKTHTLAECLKHTGNKKQLILTHTHAGIASIKEKIKSINVDNASYNVETISGFAQRYVNSLYSGDKMKDIDDDKYFDFIINEAICLFKNSSVKRIIYNSYKGILVDEYQDCTRKQHEFIMLMSDVLPTRLLGDPLQGIFDFDGTSIDFDVDLRAFSKYSLNTPWRWYKDGNNKKLGDSLKEIREILVSNSKCINFRNYPDITFHKIDNEEDKYIYKSYYKRELNSLVYAANQSLLILLPSDFASNTSTKRANVRSRLGYSDRIILLEPFDDKEYYEISKKIDYLATNKEKAESSLYIRLKNDVVLPLFNKTDVSDWFGDTKIKSKRGDNKEKSLELNEIVSSFVKTPSLGGIYRTLYFLSYNLGLKTKRHELVRVILNATKGAIVEGEAVFEIMKKNKNITRRVGRKVNGKCLGTTLLTKGLEFDTVVILDAHKFQCPKHFYVAITRACKRLIVFSKTEMLSFNL